MFGKSFLENNYINCEITTEDITYLNNEIKYEKIKEICCELLELCQRIYEKNDKEIAKYLVKDFLTYHSLAENIDINTILKNIVKFTDNSEIGFICKIKNPFELCLSKSYLLVTKSQFISKDDDLDDFGYIKNFRLIKGEFLYNERKGFCLFDLKDKKLLIRDNKFLIFANHKFYDKHNILYLDYFFSNNNEKNNSLKKYDNLNKTSNEVIILVKNSVEESILENDFQNNYQPKNEYLFKVKIVFKNKIDNCSHMFSGCKNLIYIDLSHFNSVNINNMSYMFYYCENLKNIDLSYLNTEKVTDMSYLFCGCNKLEKIDLSSFKTQNVEKMISMFMFCSNLIEIDLKNFDTKKVRSMRSMFKHCEKLKLINLKSFQTDMVNDMNFMFEFCSYELHLDLSSFNFKNIDSNNSIFMFGYTDRDNVIIKDEFKKIFTWKNRTYGYSLYF